MEWAAWVAWAAWTCNVRPGRILTLAVKDKPRLGGACLFSASRSCVRSGVTTVAFEPLHSNRCIRTVAFDPLHSIRCIRSVAFGPLRSDRCARERQPRRRRRRLAPGREECSGLDRRTPSASGRASIPARRRRCNTASSNECLTDPAWASAVSAARSSSPDGSICMAIAVTKCEGKQQS